MLPLSLLVILYKFPSRQFHKCVLDSSALFAVINLHSCSPLNWNQWLPRKAKLKTKQTQEKPPEIFISYRFSLSISLSWASAPIYVFFLLPFYLLTLSLRLPLSYWWHYWFWVKSNKTNFSTSQRLDRLEYIGLEVSAFIIWRDREEMCKGVLNDTIHD